MDKDEMFLLDPMGSDFNFRVRVLAFYNPPPADINGGRIHDLHIMDHDLIESRLQLLQFIATKQGSAVAKNIQEATAYVVSHQVDDITVVDTILDKANKQTRSSKDVVFLSIAMWMHRPRGYYAEVATQRDTCDELLAVIQEEATSLPTATNVNTC
jgi:hypothetical protein